MGQLNSLTEYTANDFSSILFFVFCVSLTQELYLSTTLVNNNSHNNYNYKNYVR